MDLKKIVINSQEDFDKIDKFYNLEIEIRKSVKIDNEIRFEYCNIIINLENKPKINVNETKIEFVECKICFVGSTNDAIFECRESVFICENCEIYQSGKNNDDFPIFIFLKGVPKKYIELIECDIHDLHGMIIGSNSISVRVENCIVKNNVGNFLSLVSIAGLENTPSLNMYNNTFENCRWNDSKGINDKMYSMLSKGSEAMDLEAGLDALIKINNVCAGHIFKQTFIKCGKCLYAPRGFVEQRLYIEECNFIDCNENEDYQINIWCYNLSVKKCIFERSVGMRLHPQYSDMLLENLIFKDCKTTGKEKKTKYDSYIFEVNGVLDIFSEIDSPCVKISNCLFESCSLYEKDKYGLQANNGIIYINGVPERGMARAIVLENYKIVKCKAAKMIHGKVDGCTLYKDFGEGKFVDWR